VTRFSAGTRAEAVVDASRDRVWAALTDPDVVAALTPFVRRIVPVGSGPAERWRWEMTGLSVLGVGIPPGYPSWGNLIEEAVNYYTNLPWLMVWPGLGILIATLAFNLLGDGLRDALDPRGGIH
jgi:hypothetical protein